MKCFKISTLFVVLMLFSISSQADQPLVHLIKIDDYIVNPVVAQYINRSIEYAQKDKAQCLIIELDTPGGLLMSTRSIVKDLMNADIPIIVYVAPQGARAGSAGVFITLAGHLAAMAPSTNIGAAHPVQLRTRKSTGESIKEIIEIIFKRESPADSKQGARKKDVMDDKIINDTLAWVSTIAKSRGRNVAWARQAVIESVSVTEDEALELGIVNFIASDTGDLLRQIDGTKITTVKKSVILKTKNALVKTQEMGLRRKILNVIANPTIAYVLLLLGFYGLLFEFTHPGIGFPGIAGVIAVIVAFYGLQMLPTDYAGVVLIILALILFIAEVKVPGFGLLALGGIVCMLLGSLILVNSPYEFMNISLRIIVPFTLTTAAIVIFLVGAVIRVHRKKVTSGKEGLLGERGKALTSISDCGKVFIHGEIWNARSEIPIDKGSEIEVIGVQGMTIWVKQTKEDTK